MWSAKGFDRGDSVYSDDRGQCITTLEGIVYNSVSTAGNILMRECVNQGITGVVLHKQ